MFKTANQLITLLINKATIGLMIPQIHKEWCWDYSTWR